ncbi:kinase-like domain-containing protein [Penicillium longicatenatum]|nr:kinase-like domain-containing protein [Penicillium longicatenatum]
MPYCGGGSLKSFLSQEEPRKDKISTEELNCWIIQILRAVAFLHAKDIVHGDLKPEHVLFTTEGAVKRGSQVDAALTIKATHIIMVPISELGIYGLAV